MKTDLSLDSLVPLSILVVGLVLFGGAFIYLELRKPVKLLVFRISAVVVLLIALFLLFSRPSWTGQGRLRPLVVLTEAYDKQLADSLRKQDEFSFVRLPGADHYPGAEVLTSTRQMGELSSRITYVLGEGIPREVLSNEFSFNYFPSELPEGIVALSLPEFQVGRGSVVRGTFYSKGTTVINLVDPTGARDSCRIGSGLGEFRFTIKTKASGKFIYYLEYVDGSGTSIREPVPVVSKHPASQRVLVLQQSPSFEVRFLKNYLASQGHQVTVRASVSSKTYHHEFLNHSASPFNTLSSQILETYDLLILSPEAWKGMRSSEQGLVQKAVRGGLGILTLFTSGDQTQLMKEMYGKVSAGKGPDKARIQINEDILEVLAAPIRFHDPSATAIFNDGKGMLSGYLNYGQGRLGFQCTMQTYSLALEGRLESYASLWAPILEKVGRRHAAIDVNWVTSFPLVEDEPIEFKLQGMNAASKVGWDQEQIPVLQEAIPTELYRGTLWSDKGWHQLSANDSTLAHCYVVDRAEWNSLQRANRIRENKKHHRNVNDNNELSESVRHQISETWLLVVILLSAGFLWGSPKL